MSSSMGMTGVAQMCKFDLVETNFVPKAFAPLADYCASKAAIIAMHESLRYELDKRYYFFHSIFLCLLSSTYKV